MSGTDYGVTNIGSCHLFHSGSVTDPLRLFNFPTPLGVAVSFEGGICRLLRGRIVVK